MAEKKHDQKKRYHRGRKKAGAKQVRRDDRNVKKKKSGIVSTIILIIAIVVFCFSSFKLYKIFSGYQKGQKEYESIKELAIEKTGEDEERFKVNFEELLSINPDTVGWIRFHPKPSQISYPVVQGKDNDRYLTKTFSANDNTVGAIFVNVYNKADFNDKNTIVYGHRMNDNSMFHDLAKYEDKSFWEANPYFYIYTPDGREITYHIYSAGVVKDTSDTYVTEFGSDEAYQEFLNMTKEVSNYDTGVELKTDDAVVTLSTCTKESNEDRFVVRGVKESEKIIE